INWGGVPSAYTMRVENNKFNNVLLSTSTVLYGADNARIWRNETDGGIRLYGSSGFTFEENEEEGTVDGFIIEESGSFGNELFLNKDMGSDNGFKMQQNNIGLLLLCNSVNNIY